MHAVVVHVTVHDREAATAALNEVVVPRVSGSPGFVGGTWVALPGGKGCSIAVFESEDAARAVADQIQPPGDFITLDSVEVGEVVGRG